jgi:hypothetical protein
MAMSSFLNSLVRPNCAATVTPAVPAPTITTLWCGFDADTLAKPRLPLSNALCRAADIASARRIAILDIVLIPGFDLLIDRKSCVYSRGTTLLSLLMVQSWSRESTSVSQSPHSSVLR